MGDWHKVIELEFKGVVVQRLHYNCRSRRATIVKLWKQLYGKSFNKAQILINGKAPPMERR